MNVEHVKPGMGGPAPLNFQRAQQQPAPSFNGPAQPAFDPKEAERVENDLKVARKIENQIVFDISRNQSEMKKAQLDLEASMNQDNIAVTSAAFKRKREIQKDLRNVQSQLTEHTLKHKIFETYFGGSEAGNPEFVNQINTAFAGHAGSIQRVHMQMGTAASKALKAYLGTPVEARQGPDGFSKVVAAEIASSLVSNGGFDPKTYSVIEDEMSNFLKKTMMYGHMKLDGTQDAGAKKTIVKSIGASVQMLKKMGLTDDHIVAVAESMEQLVMEAVDGEALSISQAAGMQDTTKPGTLDVDQIQKLTNLSELKSLTKGIGALHSLNEVDPEMGIQWRDIHEIEQSKKIIPKILASIVESGFGSNRTATLLTGLTPELKEAVTAQLMEVREQMSTAMRAQGYDVTPDDFGSSMMDNATAIKGYEARVSELEDATSYVDFASGKKIAENREAMADTAQAEVQMREQEALRLQKQAGENRIDNS